MNIYNQAGLFTVQLGSVTKAVGDFSQDTMVLVFKNIAVDETFFLQAVVSALIEGAVENLSSTIKVTLRVNAEHLLDGESDQTDIMSYLEKMAGKVLDRLKVTPGWGTADSANLRDGHDLLD